VVIIRVRHFFLSRAVIITQQHHQHQQQQRTKTPVWTLCFLFILEQPAFFTENEEKHESRVSSAACFVRTPVSGLFIQQSLTHSLTPLHSFIHTTHSFVLIVAPTPLHSISVCAVVVTIDFGLDWMGWDHWPLWCVCVCVFVCDAVAVAIAAAAVWLVVVSRSTRP